MARKAKNPQDLLDRILKLSVPERMQLVEDIWESIAAFPDAIELTPTQRRDLDRRFASMNTNPDSCIPWEIVKKEIFRKRQLTIKKAKNVR